MYKVTIRLEDGRDVYYTETSIIRAAARVEEYHDTMLWCDIQQIREDGDNGGGKVDKDNH
jgi:hypothetical protein